MARRALIHVLALTALAACMCSCATRPPTHTTIALDDHVWTMELAIGEDAIKQGLMHRDHLAEGTGMLFVFPRPEPRQFWMAWCVMDIDLAFLDAFGRIVAVHRMTVEPSKGEQESEFAYLNRMPSYPSGVPVRFAAEFPAGTIDRVGMKRGDKFTLDVRTLLDRAQHTP